MIPSPQTITRREAVIRLATLMGASVLGPRLFAATFVTGANHGFSAAEIALLDEAGDTIIPATDVPGARAVGIGAFIAMMINDCYEPADQAVFKTGLETLVSTYRSRFGGEFVAGPAAQRTAFLNELDREQREYTARKTEGQPPHFFRMLKELTILGYFSSEIGATQALRYSEVPGSFDGDAPYQKGDRAWFN